MCIVSKLCKGLSLIFPPNCGHLLCCGESIIISEGRFPNCVWVSVCQVGAGP